MFCKLYLVLQLIRSGAGQFDENMNWLSSSYVAMDEKHDTVIDYVTQLICNNRSSYRFFHIYVDKSTSTMMPDRLMSDLNECMSAGILTST